jgi:hypothetical protein
MVVAESKSALEAGTALLCNMLELLYGCYCPECTDQKVPRTNLAFVDPKTELLFMLQTKLPACDVFNSHVSLLFIHRSLVPAQ